VIGNEAALQLSMPVWQRNRESLIQAGIRKNGICRAMSERCKIFREDWNHTPCNQPASLSSRSEPVLKIDVQAIFQSFPNVRQCTYISKVYFLSGGLIAKCTEVSTRAQQFQHIAVFEAPATEPTSCLAVRSGVRWNPIVNPKLEGIQERRPGAVRCPKEWHGNLGHH
jgi:hypothetical protein